jgi:hypothetical protein
MRLRAGESGDRRDVFCYLRCLLPSCYTFVTPHFRLGNSFQARPFYAITKLPNFTFPQPHIRP